MKPEILSLDVGGFHNSNENSITHKKTKQTYYERNSEKIKAQKKQYYKKNKEKAREYEKKNKDKIKIRHAIWKQNNKEHIKQYAKKYAKKYHENNIEKLKKYINEYNKTNRCKHNIRNSFRRLVDNWYGGRAASEQLLGYSLKDLQIHLSQFGDMKDKNMHIDHIIPISYLRKHIKNEQLLLKTANNLRNLMLLNSDDNMKKHDKLTIEYVPDFHMYNFFEYVCELIEYIQKIKENNS